MIFLFLLLQSYNIMYRRVTTDAAQSFYLLREGKYLRVSISTTIMGELSLCSGAISACHLQYALNKGC